MARILHDVNDTLTSLEHDEEVLHHTACTLNSYLYLFQLPVSIFCTLIDHFFCLLGIDPASPPPWED